MGKDYGNTETSYFELFSMGMEAVYAGSYNIAMDTEYPRVNIWNISKHIGSGIWNIQLLARYMGRTIK
jgi:hypothetical protein